ncbi:MarR family winged helix-turn-helix transcriptional regulator [Sphingomonas sp.]|uniref:MarR family winged helix-turn-helix transcriptional regulator n=1 Tax=Sphingomonas sp. TaxID=28214 RepID=UPI00181E6605|nr:MarR family transcriptional regulator [Sphingomonas sp.]MBA4761752.1 MarR family transcriptional regulator [Sphingomonas sp.]
MTDTPRSADQGDPLDQFLCFSVYAAGLAFNRVYKPLLDRFGITYPQYLALVALRGGVDLTVSALGAKLHLESNTLTPLIKRLEAAGLVTRTRDKQDERVVRLALTDAGHRLIDEALGCIPVAVLEATGMQLEELQTLNGKLAALGAALRSAPALSGGAAD